MNETFFEEPLGLNIKATYLLNRIRRGVVEGEIGFWIQGTHFPQS